MHAPDWAERVAHLGTLVRWEGTFELRLCTLAALVVGRHFKAQYVWGIQRVIGTIRRSTGILVTEVRQQYLQKRKVSVRQPWADDLC